MARFRHALVAKQIVRGENGSIRSILDIISEGARGADLATLPVVACWWLLCWCDVVAGETVTLATQFDWPGGRSERELDHVLRIDASGVKPYLLPVNAAIREPGPHGVTLWLNGEKVWSVTFGLWRLVPEATGTQDDAGVTDPVETRD